MVCSTALMPHSHQCLFKIILFTIKAGIKYFPTEQDFRLKISSKELLKIAIVTQSGFSPEDFYAS